MKAYLAIIINTFPDVAVGRQQENVQLRNY